MKGYAFLIIGLAVFAPFLYDSYRSLKILIFNPGSFEYAVNLKSHKIQFRDAVRNCEDVVMDTQSGFALLSCSPGRDKWNTVMGNLVDPTEHGSLYLYNYASTPEKEPTLISLDGFDKPFHPIGLNYDSQSRTIVIANHGGDAASVEVFTFDPDTSKATHRQSITDSSALPTPNALVFINQTHLYVTNTHSLCVFTAPTTPLEHLRVRIGKVEPTLGVPTGSVSLVDLTTGKATKILSHAFANGIEILDEGKTLALASTIKAAIYFYNITSNPAAPESLGRTTVPFFPDNISAGSEGRLLVAGHPDIPELNKMVANNWRCHGKEKGAEGTEGCGRAPSWVVEVDRGTGGPKTAVVKDLYIGDEYASSSGVSYDAEKNVLLIAGLYERGLLIAEK